MKKWKPGEKREYYREWFRWHHLKKKYGITQEEYEALLEAQGNKCAICGSTDPKWKHGFHVDHCHRTGIIRGLLCNGCNPGLGCFRDDSTIVEKAAAYLRAHEERLGRH